MSALLLDGTLVSSLRKEQLKERVHQYTVDKQQAPGLAVILIGSDPASSVYVQNKRKACETVGIKSFSYDLPELTCENELLELINRLNHCNEVNGILIQLPLPTHINTNNVLEHINPDKDVDGFHPYNVGRLVQRNPFLRPCTPMGIINLLNHYQLAIKGKHAVVIGASNIVGRPMGLELLLVGATVTICHKYTTQLQHHVELADIVIVAVGKIDVIKTDWLNKNQVIIDVGIHRLANGIIRGDVNFNEAAEKVAAITPVPGGVGPMTIISLLENTLQAAELKK
jgi:methylenetetrahydrofolate dehydrogenase (NADP+)/methenyltetrahydrofolate cyclohydrolase